MMTDCPDTSSMDTWTAAEWAQFRAFIDETALTVRDQLAAYVDETGSIEHWLQWAEIDAMVRRRQAEREREGG